MANIVRTVEIIFSGDATSMRGAVTDVNQAFELMQKAVSAIVDPLANLSRGLRGIGTAIATISVDALQKAVSVSQDYEKAIVELTRATEEEVYSLEAVKKTVSELAYAFGETETSIVNSAAAFAHAGFSIEESLKGAEGALTLTALGAGTLAESSEKLVTIMLGLRAPFEEVTRILDMLSVVAIESGTDIACLSDAFAQSAQVGTNAGLEWEEIAAMLATIGEVFKGSEEAASAFKITLARLANATGTTKDALEELKIEQQEGNGQWRTAGSLLKEVMEKMKGLSEAEQQRIANMVAGNRQGQRMILVLEEGNRWQELYKKGVTATGTAQEQLNKVMATGESALNRYNAMLENLQRLIGDELNTGFADLTQAVTELGKAFASSIEAGAFDPILDEFKATMEELKEYLADVAKALPKALADVDFEPLLSAWEDFVDTISSYMDNIDLQTPNGLADVLQRISDTLATLITVLNGMAKELKPVWDQIQAGIDLINKLDPATKESFGKLLINSELVKKFGFIFVGVFDTMMDAIIKSSKSIDVFTVETEISMNRLDLWTAVIEKAFLQAQKAVLTFLDTLPFTDFAEEIEALEEDINATTVSIESATKKGIELNKRREEGIKQANMSSEEFLEYLLKQEQAEEEAIVTTEKHTEKISVLGEVIESLPESKIIKIEPGESIADFIDRLKNLKEGIIQLPDGKIIPITPSFKEEALEQIKKELNDLEDTETIVTITTVADATAFNDVLQNLDKIPDTKLIEIAVANMEGLLSELDKAEEEVNRVADEEYLINLGIDTNALEAAEQELAELMVKVMELEDPAEIKILIPDIEAASAKVMELIGKVKEIPEDKKVGVHLEQTGVPPEEVKKKLEKIPTQIDIEIKLREISVKEFEAQTDRIVKTGELANDRLKASVDLAKTQIEADANVMIAALQGLADAIASVADAAASMYSAYVDAVQVTVNSTSELDRVTNVLQGDAKGLDRVIGDVKDGLREYNDALADSVHTTLELIAETNDLETAIVDLNKSLKTTKADIKEYTKLLNELESGSISQEGLNQRLAAIDAMYDRLETGIDMGASAEELRSISDEIDRMTRAAELYEEALNDPKQARRDITEEIISLKESERDINKEIVESTAQIKENEVLIGEELKKQDEYLAKIAEALEAMGYSEKEIAAIITEIKDKLTVIYKEAKETDDYFRSWTNNLSAADSALKKFSEQLATMFEDAVTPFLDKFMAKQMEMVDKWAKDVLVPSLEALGVDIAEMVGVEVEKRMLSPSDKEYLRNILSRQIAMERDLVDAQVDYMEAVTKVAVAKAKAYEQGMPEISISAEGMEPELEAFMWKILDKIQTRVSEQYGEFLLGLYGINTSTEELV